MALYVNIEKKLGDFHLKVNFTAQTGVLALLGASGCGKTMTLKCIAGIETPDRGQILLNGVPLFDSEKRINLPPQKRRVGLLFQNYALFPHMTVLKNLKAGCRRQNSREKLDAYIQMLHLEELLNHYPRELSGGQQQRAAIARMLLSEPEVLLLDEPFSALDAHLRFQLEREMLEVLKAEGKPTILVSHDRDEVFRMSESIAVMNRGAIDVQGDRDTVFRSPRTPAAARLTGCKNIAPCQMLSNTRVAVPQWGMELTIPETRAPITHIGIRMHDICPGPGENHFACTLASLLENPFSYVAMLRAAPEARPIGWEMDKATWQQWSHEPISVSLPPEKLLLLAEPRKDRL